MTKIFSIIQHEDITEVSFSSPPEMADLLEATIAHATTEVSRKRLWDMSCGYNVSTDELQQIAKRGRVVEMPVNSKVAIVAPDDLSFGITRVYSALRQDPRSQHQTFRSRDKTIAWLNEPSD